MESRGSHYAKGLLQIKNEFTRDLGRLTILIMESILPEEKKRKFMKEIKTAEKEGRPTNLDEVFGIDPEEKAEMREFALKLIQHSQEKRKKPRKVKPGVILPKINANRLKEYLLAS